MGDNLREFYLQYCLEHIQTALQKGVGQPANVVVDEELFRKTVSGPGWEALPASLRRAGRDNIRWDEFLLEVRKEVFHREQGKVVLRPDAGERILVVIEDLFGGLNKTPPAGPAPVARGSSPPAAPARPRGETASVPIAAPVAPPASGVRARSGPAETAGPRTEEHAIGIDLGTTYSVVAYMDAHGRPCTIPNKVGDLITPSVILMDEGGPIVGKEAVLAAPLEPEKIASCFKRDMGAKTYRKKVNNEYFPPEVLSSLILRALQEDAQRKLGSVTKAVITVPAYFDESRRRATLDAGRLAGLEVLGIINEPTAAAIAYGYQLGFLDNTVKVIGDKSLRVLVYDLGGGTFDVTIVHIEGRSFKALATDGDIALGGKDWDEKLMEIAAERIKAQIQEDPRHDPNTLQELYQAAETAKKTLSERAKTTMYVNHHGTRHKVEVTRQEFEEATASLLGRTCTTTEIVVRQAGLKWSDIDIVLLVGGSSRMPMVLRMLEEISGKPPERSVSPDEAIAHGAALYAHLLLDRKGKTRSGADFSITNVNSHSLGIVGIDKGTGRRINQVLIPKNTALPHSVSATFKTHKPDQPNVLIRIVEGESQRPEACIQIGTCKVEPLPAHLPAGTPIFVQYSYLADGQLRVSAQVKGQSKAVSTVFLRDNSMGEEDITRWKAYLASKMGVKA